MKTSILIYCVIVVMLAACASPASETPAPSLTPSSPPTSTSTPIPTATYTITPSPTPTLTYTPTPLPSPTPIPSPTPVGYYASESRHLALICPEDWEITEGEHGVECVNEKSGIFFSADSEILGEASSLENFIKDMDEGLEDTHEILGEDEITFKDGTKAQRVKLVFNKYRHYVDYLVFAQVGSRAYYFWGAGPKTKLALDPRALDEIFESIELVSGKLYGLDRGKTLVLLGREPFPEDLDPAKMAQSAADFIGHIYSGLVRLSPQLQIEPDLAETWTISPDGTIYTFTLRGDASFESGKQLTAEDVKYSWERTADPKNESPTAATYLGDIIGFKDKLDGKAQEIEGVRVLDDRTLEVRLDGPKPYFLAKLTYPTSYIVDQESVKTNPEKWMFEPNASGPYDLQEYREDVALIFKRNEKYHQIPAIENIVYMLYLAGTPASYHQAGEIDLTWLSNLEAKDILDNPDDPLNSQLHSVTTLCTSYLQFDNTRPPLDDPQVRRALSLALDKDRLNNLITEDLSVIAKSILPPAMPGYSPDTGEEVYDPEAAKEALAASSYAGKMPTIVINTFGYAGEDDPYLTALIDMWNRTLGVKTVIDYVDPQLSIKALRDADGHVVAQSWCADYPDPENFLDILFHSDSLFNYTNYTNPEVDELLEKARVERNPEKRLKMYKQIETILLEDHAVVPLMYPVDYSLVNPRITGFVMAPMHASIVHLLSIEE